MSAVAYTSFLADLNLSTTSCPEFERLTRVRDAAQDFCRRSFMWRTRELALFTTIAAQEVYDISSLIPADAELVGLHSAWANGYELDVEVPGQGDDFEPGSTDCQWVVGVDGPSSLHALPAPDSGGIAVTGSLSFGPSETSTGIPDFIFNRWHNDIASGAIAALCSQAGKAWTNPGLAAFHKAKFDSAVALAASRAGPVRRKGLRVKIQDASPCWPYPGSIY